MLTVTYTYNLQNLLQIFPLPSETVYVNTAANARPLNTRVKSNLAQELEANNRKLRELRKAQIGDTTDEKELAKYQEKSKNGAIIIKRRSNAKEDTKPAPRTGLQERTKKGLSADIKKCVLMKIKELNVIKA